MGRDKLAGHSTPSLRALSYRFAVRSDDPALGRHVDDALTGLREPGPARPVEHLYSVTVADDPRRVDVFCDGETLALGQRPGEALGWVMWDVNRTAAEESGRHLLFHAGALDAAGTGVLVPGPSGSGKSTLVAGLARAGLGYLTDELAALDLSSGQLLPYAKPITIKRGSFEVLRDMLPSSVAGPNGGRWPAEERHVPVGPGTGRKIGRACPPGIVVVPHYDPAARTQLAPLSDTEAFFYLALNAVNLLPHGGAGTAELGRLVAGCTCVALTMSDLDAACALVLELVAEHAACFEAGVGVHAG